MSPSHSGTPSHPGPDDGAREPGVVVVAGVAGTGKSTVGRRLAARFGVAFVDADDLHDPDDVAAMRAGRPLDEDRRRRWLGRVGRALAGAVAVVTACSCLRRAHREQLRALVPGLRFVVLEVPRDELEARLVAREHFFPVVLLDDQIASYEPPDDEPATLVVDGSRPVTDVVDEAVRWLSGGMPSQ